MFVLTEIILSTLNRCIGVSDHSGKVFMESRKVFMDSGKMFMDSGKVFMDSGKVFMGSGTYPPPLNFRRFLADSNALFFTGHRLYLPSSFSAYARTFTIIILNVIKTRNISTKKVESGIEGKAGSKGKRERRESGSEGKAGAKGKRERRESGIFRPKPAVLTPL